MTAFLFFSEPDSWAVSSFASFIAYYGYIGIFIWFITIDQVTPIPEEFSLLLLGYLCAQHVFNPFLAALVAFGGFITVDMLYFLMARSGGKLVKRRTDKPRSAFVTRYRRKLRKHLPRTLLVLSFIPRMRMWGRFFAAP